MGKLVRISSAVGIPALDTLVGMGVNCSSGLDGHDKRRKIGVIERAWAGDLQADGSTPVHVEGYLFAKDFPEEVADLVAEKDSIGFSYECEVSYVDIEGSMPPTVDVLSVTFTGSAILYKSKAAYGRTSLAAEGDDMNEEQVRALIASAVSEVMEKIEANRQAELTASTEAQVGLTTLTNQVADLMLKHDVNSALATEYESLKASFDEVVAKVEANATALQAEADAREAHARKSSVATKQTLVAKYAVEGTDLQSTLATISARADLTVEDRLALKMEAIEANRKTAV